MQETIAPAPAATYTDAALSIQVLKPDSLLRLYGTAKAMPCLSGAFGPQKAMKIFPR